MLPVSIQQFSRNSDSTDFKESFENACIRSSRKNCQIFSDVTHRLPTLYKEQEAEQSLSVVFRVYVKYVRVCNLFWCVHSLLQVKLSYSRLACTFLMNQIYAVSYTHLDVYKRQVLERLESSVALQQHVPGYVQSPASFYGSFPVCTLGRPVSYTHLLYIYVLPSVTRILGQ